MVPPKNLVIRVGDDMDNSPRFNFQAETTALLRMSDKVRVLVIATILSTFLLFGVHFVIHLIAKTF